MDEDTPQQRFIAAMNSEMDSDQKRRRQTLKAIIVENLDEIVRFHDEKNVDYGEIASKLSDAYKLPINERSFRTTVSLLRTKRTASKPKGESVRVQPSTSQGHVKATPAAVTSSSVEVIRDDDPDL